MSKLETLIAEIENIRNYASDLNITWLVDRLNVALGEYMSKGDTYRPVDRKKYEQNYEKIFKQGKKAPEEFKQGKVIKPKEQHGKNT